MPDVIIVRKKPTVETTGKTLKRLKFTSDNKKNKKKEEEEKGEMKAFLEEMCEEKEFKDNLINENEEEIEQNNGKKEI